MTSTNLYAVMPPAPDSLWPNKTVAPMPAFPAIEYVPLADSGTHRLLVLLCDTEDQPAIIPAEHFDTTFFVRLADYFRTVSHGEFNIVPVDLPSEIGWLRMPDSMSHYTCNNFGLCLGMHDMVNAAMDSAATRTDLSAYSAGVTIVHSGRGAEQGGGPNTIWSHQWQTQSGVRYMTVPEHYWLNNAPLPLTIGVPAHELGHLLFGWPDLYGQYSGVGMWSLMADGGWNGTLGSNPCWPDAWCRHQAGWGTVVELSDNESETSLTVRPLTVSDTTYFFAMNPTMRIYIENRAESGLPYSIGSALIWMADDNGEGGVGFCPPLFHSEYIPILRLLQPQNCRMETQGSRGSAGSVWPYDTMTALGSYTLPSTRTYEKQLTGLRLSNIKRIGERPHAVTMDVCLHDDQGDLNDDGYIEGADLAMAVEMIFGGAELDDRLDVNCDGVLNIFDWKRLQQTAWGRFAPCTGCR